MTRATVVRVLICAGITLVGIALVAAVLRFVPQRDPLPTQLARQDEKAAAGSAAAIGRDVERQTRDASINIDLTTKEIRDAFDALPAPQPPAPSPSGGAVPRDLPAAPVERVRDRLNQGVARANRAAGTADAAD